MFHNPIEIHTTWHPTPVFFYSYVLISWNAKKPQMCETVSQSSSFWVFPHVSSCPQRHEDHKRRGRPAPAPVGGTRNPRTLGARYERPPLYVVLYRSRAASLVCLFRCDSWYWYIVPLLLILENWLSTCIYFSLIYFLNPCTICIFITAINFFSFSYWTTAW